MQANGAITSSGAMGSSAEAAGRAQQLAKQQVEDKAMQQVRLS